MGMFVTIVSALLLMGFCAGGPATLPPETGTCWVIGDIHYSTFNSHYYNFMGNCTYTMAKNCHVDAAHPAFEVEVKNVNQANSQVPAMEMVTVIVHGTAIDIGHLQYGFVRINYQLWSLPINLDNGKVTLSQSGLSVIIQADFGLTVRYDWEQHLVITVPGSFAGKVCGMCGNFNNKQEADLTTPTGSVASNVSALGQTWRVPGTTDDCREECTGKSSPKCPEKSHFEFCGTACPATCANPDAPSKCKVSCVETCACDDGLLRSGNKCVPKAQCGCMYNGFYVEAGASFWGDETCTKRYECAGGRLALQETSCPLWQQCQVVKGIRDCYPMTNATCMIFGDQHVVTFDGQSYNLHGTCAYQMAGVASINFSVVLHNNGQNQEIGSTVTLVEVKVYGYTIVISKEHPGSVMVNGELNNLPMSLDSNKLQLYTCGWFAVIETDFGAEVYYDWISAAFVNIPSTYFGAVRGMCGNYNLNPKDDMLMRDGKPATTAEELGQSWRVSTIPDCVNGCKGPCRPCDVTQKDLQTDKYCGIISDPAGPFRDCHSKVDPAVFLKDCLYDVCLYQGSSGGQCKTLTGYTAACHLKGAKVHPWRSAQFCNVQCPSNRHYELCTDGCAGSCQSRAVLSDCGAQCMEGCVCDEGFGLSGDECVPLAQCGCLYKGKYYLSGQVFYPDALCQQECTCNGTVQCEKSSCGPHEKCELKNGVRSCQPDGYKTCTISGDPHYKTFDNSTYNFQGTCTYAAAEACRLEGTRLKPFSVVVENEKWYGVSANPKVSVAKLVAVEVHGTILILRRNQIGMVMVNGVLAHLPLSLNNGAVKVYQQGLHDVIITDFGLRVTYDLVYHVTVTVPSTYWGRTCGLCGNFNDNKADEFQLPGGNVTSDILTFGAAWKVSVPGVVCEDGCSGDKCPTCDPSKTAVFEADCAIITKPTGPFAACHNVIDPASYYRDCVYDVCLATGEHNMLCHSIAAYVTDCQYVGAKIQNWRSPSFCPLNCSANSHYETCARFCATPCPGLSDIVTCSTTCAEGCGCNEGYYYQGAGCVTIDQCGCYSDGNTYMIGDSIVSPDCLRLSTCQTSGMLLSQNMACKRDESCRVKNSVLGCHLNHGL